MAFNVYFLINQSYIINPQRISYCPNIGPAMT